MNGPLIAATPTAAVDPLEAATAAGLRPGSAEWTAEVRRLRALRTQDEEWERHAERYRALWGRAQPATPDHGHLKSHGVTSATGLRQIGDRLLIPMKDIGPEARLMNLQSIWPDGRKLFGKGGRAARTRTTIGAEAFRPDGKLFICEGWCTGWTINHATGEAAVVAFFAGNLEPVAVAMRERYPQATIIIAADNDRWRGER